MIGVLEGVCVIPKALRGKNLEVLWWSLRGEAYVFGLCLLRVRVSVRVKGTRKNPEIQLWRRAAWRYTHIHFQCCEFGLGN